MLTKIIKKKRIKIDTGGFEFLTQEGVNITGRVRNIQTSVFKKRKDADVLAKKSKSYVYEVNFYETSCEKFQDSGNRIVELYGFAVPK